MRKDIHSLDMVSRAAPDRLHYVAAETIRSLYEALSKVFADD